MSQRGEIHRFTTADGEMLHGLLCQPSSGSRKSVLVMIHGVAMNFYTGPLPTFAAALADRGYACFSMNTRGHDWIVRSGDLTAFGGATYERFEDCLLDIDAVLDELRQQGFERFVLVGHSLGALKVVFYCGRKQRADVVGVVSCSAPEQYYTARAREDQEFPARMQRAEELVKKGKGQELIWAPASGAKGLFAANTYVSKYGPREITDVRSNAASLGCPLLAMAGSTESSNFREYATQLSEAAGERGTYLIVPHANHFYLGTEPVVVAAIGEWLEKNGLA